MNCSCIIPNDDFDELIEFERECTPKARKEYKCYECCSLIKPGEKYNKIIGKWEDDKITTFRTCLDCVSIKDIFFSDGYVFGEIWEALEEFIKQSLSYNQFPWSCLTELTPGARAAVCGVIENIWGEEE